MGGRLRGKSKWLGQCKHELSFMKGMVNVHFTYDCFGQLQLHRVSLGVFDFNLAAIACYEKAGFVKEGLLREARKVGNEFWNLWEMSILEREWITPYHIPSVF